jgi:hypothetical protein
MMWMLFAMVGNRQEAKWLAIECKALKWAKANKAPPPRIALTSPHGRWDDYDITFTITMTIKQRRLECIECINKRDELYDVPTCYMKFLKYDPFWHWIESICYVKLKNNLVEVKVQGASNAMDYYFTTTFSYNSKLVWGKMYCKSFIDLKTWSAAYESIQCFPHCNGMNSTWRLGHG